ncbi:MAG TPA: hypothetical protein VKT78_04530 [Fimbriimonadaceae bacterium]|nr:hypothetical protein [Fimbriimonadaceae bacterium]
MIPLIAVLIFAQPEPALPHVPGFRLTHARRIRTPTSDYISVSEDGAATITLDSVDGPARETVTRLRDGATRATELGLLLSFDQVVYFARDDGPKPRFHTDLFDLRLNKFVARVPETLPHVRPHGRWGWGIPGGLESIVVKGAQNLLYRVTYSWRSRKASYRRIGRLPGPADGYSNITLVAIERDGAHAILGTGLGDAYWVRSRPLVDLGLVDSSLWLGAPMRFSHGKIEEFGRDGRPTVLCRGWTFLGKNAMGDLVVLRRDSDSACFLLHAARESSRRPRERHGSAAKAQHRM